MRSQCGPPKFDQKDWSKFDFTRWHLDGVTEDSTAAAFAGLADKLFNSEEWRQTFQATLPQLQQRALDLFKDHSKNLRDERTAAAEDFERRAVAAEKRSEGFRKSLEVAAAPPTVEASPDMFHVAVRVVSEKDDRLGLPDMTVQILDPKNEKAVVAESFTNFDGNTIVTVPPAVAKELDKRDTTLQITDPTGRSLAKLPNGVCIRVGQTESRVVKVRETESIAEHKRQAETRRNEREGRARHLAGRSEVIRKEREKVLENLDCRLRDSEAIVAELEKTAPPQATKPSKESADDSGKESSDDQPRSSPQKRRKKT